MRILLLGGTSESRELASRSVDDPRFDVVTSLAGRVRDPRLPVGESRIGGFGGATGLTEWLRRNKIDAVVDATHPFAEKMSHSARDAALDAHIPLCILQRAPWCSEPDDRWIHADSVAEAAHAIPDDARRVFLTIGRQGVSAFAACTDAWFLIRSIDPPTGELPPNHEILLARGPFELDDEIELMKQRSIDVVVSKNSGGSMTEAKVLAARELGVPIVMVERPSTPTGVQVVDTVDSARRWLGSLL